MDGRRRGGNKTSASSSFRRDVEDDDGDGEPLLGISLAMRNLTSGIFWLHVGRT